MKTLHPLGHHLLVVPEERPSSTPAGLIIPERARGEGAKVYRVVSVGSKVKEVEDGNRIVCHSYDSGAVSVEDGSGRKLIKDDQVLMIL